MLTRLTCFVIITMCNSDHLFHVQNLFLEGLFLSKTKKIISMLLAIAIVLTVAPVSVLASAAGAVTYGAVTFSHNEFSVDTSATTEVIRVAGGTGSFTTGTTVVNATPSGIPENGGTFKNVGYGGETPEIPTIRFTITGVQLDEVPKPTAEGASLTIKDGKLVSSNAPLKNNKSATIVTKSDTTTTAR